MNRVKQLHLKPSQDTFHRGICETIHGLYRQGMFCDTRLVTTSSELYAHSVVLAACSAKLAAELRANESKRRSRVTSACFRYVLDLKARHCSRPMAAALLHYCYTGEFDFGNRKSVPRLRIVAEYLGLDPIVQLCDLAKEEEEESANGTRLTAQAGGVPPRFTADTANVGKGHPQSRDELKSVCLQTEMAASECHGNRPEEGLSDLHQNIKQKTESSQVQDEWKPSLVVNEILHEIPVCHSQRDVIVDKQAPRDFSHEQVIAMETVKVAHSSQDYVTISNADTLSQKLTVIGEGSGTSTHHGNGVLSSNLQITFASSGCPNIRVGSLAAAGPDGTSLAEKQEVTDEGYPVPEVGPGADPESEAARCVLVPGQMECQVGDTQTDSTGRNTRKRRNLNAPISASQAKLFRMSDSATGRQTSPEPMSSVTPASCPHEASLSTAEGDQLTTRNSKTRQRIARDSVRSVVTGKQQTPRAKCASVRSGTPAKQPSPRVENTSVRSGNPVKQPTSSAEKNASLKSESPAKQLSPCIKNASVRSGTPAKQLSPRIENASVRSGTPAKQQAPRAKSRVRCRYCNKSFTSKEEKTEHVRSSRAVTCPEEGCTFGTCSQKNVHKHRHSVHKLSLDYLEQLYPGECKVYRCQMCEYASLDAATVKQHKKTHEDITPFICSFCGKTFRHKHTYTAHVKGFHSAQDGRPFVCEVCSKGFLSKSNLHTHVSRVHLGVPMTEAFCEHCGFRATCNRTLYTHIWIEHDIPPPAKYPRYKCEVCGYRTVQKHSFEVHQKRHKGERPHVCDVCGRSYVTANELRCHQEFHKEPGERRFRCQHCPYGAVTRWKLNRHLSTVHANPEFKPFRCDVCDYRTNIRGNLVMHLRNTHKMAVETKKPIQAKHLLLKTARGMVNPNCSPTVKSTTSHASGKSTGSHIEDKKFSNMMSLPVKGECSMPRPVTSYSRAQEVTSLQHLPQDVMMSSDAMLQELQVLETDFTHVSVTSPHKSAHQLSFKTDPFDGDFSMNL